MSSHNEAPSHVGGDDKIAIELKKPVVYSETVGLGEERETRVANRIRWGDAIIGSIIATLPLYFVAFAIAGYVRTGTLASSLPNIAILQMSKFVSKANALWLTRLANSTVEPDYLPDPLHFHICQAHQGNRKLETRAWCYGWEHTASFGIALANLFCHHTCQASNDHFRSAYAGLLLGAEPDRRAAFTASRDGGGKQN